MRGPGGLTASLYHFGSQNEKNSCLIVYPYHVFVKWLVYSIIIFTADIGRRLFLFAVIIFAMPADIGAYYYLAAPAVWTFYLSIRSAIYLPGCPLNLYKMPV